MQREAADDSEAGVFKSDNNGTDASDDDETPKKKTKANSVPKGKGKGKDKDLVKVKNEEEENGPFNSSGSEILYGGDHATDFVDYA